MARPDIILFVHNLVTGDFSKSDIITLLRTDGNIGEFYIAIFSLLIV